MKKKFLVPLALSTTILTTLSSHSVLVNAIQTQQPEQQFHTFNQQVQQPSDVQKVLHELANVEHITNQYENYKVSDVQKDDLGYTHYTLNPEFYGTLAANQEIKIHVDETGKVVLVNGETDATSTKPENTISLSKESAIANAYSALNFKPEETDNLGNDVVKKADIELDEKQNKLVYNIEMITVNPAIGHWQIKVDAQNGQVVEKLDLIEGVAATGTGTGVLGDSKDININSLTKGYSLEDLTHKGKIIAYNYDNKTATTSLYLDEDTTFDSANQAAGVDANYYAAKVYDYYKDTHGRESYNNKGSNIISLTHVNTFNGHSNVNNAAWVGDKMIYNDGDGKVFTGLSGAKDVVAHEITHGVTQNSAKLEYYGQSGALNESFSDIFGYFVDNDDWLMGEDVYTPKIAGDALRSMSEPTKYGQPDHMKKYLVTQGDNGGVHTNSGIPNKAGYNTITAIGQEKAEKIYYRALTKYLTSKSDFQDAKRALYQSALDLYEDDETVASSVWNSWESVGVTEEA